jgi:phosphoglycolate phosphatase-like HAD superfamily hydrolase
LSDPPCGEPIEPPIRAVLFDCDGTLIDNIQLHYQLNLRITREFGMAGPVFWFPDHPTHVFLKLGWPEEKIRKFWRRFYEEELRSRPRIFPGVNELLIRLKERGILTAIVTNRHFHDGFFPLLANSGLYSSYVDFFVNYHHPTVARQIGLRSMNVLLANYPKPDVRFLDPIINWLKNLPDFPRSVLMVGDSLKIDYGLAKNCGFQFIGVATGYENRHDFLKVVDEKFIIKNVGELINMI